MVAAFSNGLHIAFDFAIAACLIAAVASLLRGRRYVHEEHGPGAGGQPSGDLAGSGTEIPGRTFTPRAGVVRAPR